MIQALKPEAPQEQSSPVEAWLEAMIRKAVREEVQSLIVDDRLLTAEQVGEYLGYSAHTVRQLNREKKLIGFMLGDNSLRFRRSEVERFIQKQERAA